MKAPSKQDVLKREWTSQHEVLAKIDHYAWIADSAEHIEQLRKSIHRLQLLLTVSVCTSTILIITLAHTEAISDRWLTLIVVVVSIIGGISTFVLGTEPPDGRQLNKYWDQLTGKGQ